MPETQETEVQPLGQEDPLEKELATHSSIRAWKIPWTEELGGLQSMGSQRVGHNLASERLHLLTHLILTTTLQGRYYYYPYLTNEETETEY